jgi:hypothetical protein
MPAEPPAGLSAGMGEERAHAADLLGSDEVVFFLVSLERSREILLNLDSIEGRAAGGADAELGPVGEPHHDGGDHEDFSGQLQPAEEPADSGCSGFLFFFHAYKLNPIG